MQAEVSLTQLYPVGEHLVVVVDLVSQLADIVHRLLTPYSFFPFLLLSYFMYDPVDKGRDAVDERDLRPLFEAEPLAVLHPQALYGQLFALLFEEVVGDVLTAFAAIHVVEEPEREEQQDDGDDDGNQHKVQLPGGLLILAGTGLKLTVLTGGLLQVEVEVAVVVALRLVIDGSIGHAELFADGSHEVRRLIDERVGERLFEVVERRFVVADLSETGSEGTIGTGNLVDVAILFENVQSVLCEPSGQHIFVDTLGIDELHRGQVVFYQLTAVVRVHQVLGEGFEGVGGEEGVVTLSGDEEAAHQVVELLLVDLLLRALRDDATRTDVIEPVEQLGGVALHLVGVDGVESLDGLFLQTHVIIIGGVDDGVLALGIVQPAQLTG